MAEAATYHPKCPDFWQDDMPVLQLYYALRAEELAIENISQRIIVPNIQPKLSLGFGLD